VTERSRDGLQVGAPPGNNPGQVVHMHVPLSPSSIIWYRWSKGGDVVCGWEGNRKSGVALAMRHGLSGLSTYGLKSLRKGDEHPAYASDGARPGLPLKGKGKVQYLL